MNTHINDVPESDTWETIPLSKPIQAHGKTLRKLSLREPITDDLIECGIPLAVESGSGSDAASGSIAAKPVAALLARLANVPLSSVRTMHPADFIQAMNKLIAFLFPDRGAKEH